MVWTWIDYRVQAKPLRMNFRTRWYNEECSLYCYYEGKSTPGNALFLYPIITVTSHERHGISNDSTNKTPKLHTIGLLWEEFTSPRWVPLAGGQFCETRFHVEEESHYLNHQQSSSSVHISVYMPVQIDSPMASWNGNISALLTLCERNPPVTSGFPPQRPVVRSFDIFFDMRLNKRLSK